jgi:hypothetical protein
MSITITDLRVDNLNVGNAPEVFVRVIFSPGDEEFQTLPQAVSPSIAWDDVFSPSSNSRQFLLKVVLLQDDTETDHASFDVDYTDGVPEVGEFDLPNGAKLYAHTTLTSGDPLDGDDLTVDSIPRTESQAGSLRSRQDKNRRLALAMGVDFDEIQANAAQKAGAIYSKLLADHAKILLTNERAVENILDTAD